MKLLGNPFIAEDFSSSFSRPLALRLYLAFLAVMSCVCMIWWPRSPLVSYLRTGSAPDSFMAAAVGLLGCMAYVSARFGAEDLSEEGSSKVHDFVTLTPVPVSSLVAGKLATAFIHIVFLLALGLPFLIVGSSVNGTPAAVVAKVALVAGFSALAFRSFAFLIFSLLEPNKILKDAVLILACIAALILTTSALPPLSPLSAILGLDPGNPYPALSIPPFRAPIPFYAVSVIINALFSAACFIASGIWLRVVRRIHAERQKERAADGGADARAERLLRRLWDDGVEKNE